MDGGEWAGDDILSTDLIRRVHYVKPYVAVIPGTENNGLSFDLGDRWQRYEDAQPVYRVRPLPVAVDAVPGEGRTLALMDDVEYETARTVGSAYIGRPQIERVCGNLGVIPRVDLLDSGVWLAVLHDLDGDYSYRIQTTGATGEQAMDRLEKLLAEIDRC